MAIVSTSPLSVEQDLTDTPWWAGNARLTNNNQQLTTNNQQPTTNNQQPTTNN